MILVVPATNRLEIEMFRINSARSENIPEAGWASIGLCVEIDNPSISHIWFDWTHKFANLEVKCALASLARSPQGLGWP